jgi:hypothetical protein
LVLKATPSVRQQQSTGTLLNDRIVSQDFEMQRHSTVNQAFTSQVQKMKFGLDAPSVSHRQHMSFIEEMKSKLIRTVVNEKL